MTFRLNYSVGSNVLTGKNIQCWASFVSVEKSQHSAHTEQIITLNSCLPKKKARLSIQRGFVKILASDFSLCLVFCAFFFFSPLGLILQKKSLHTFMLTWQGTSVILVELCSALMYSLWLMLAEVFLLNLPFPGVSRNLGSVLNVF